MNIAQYEPRVKNALDKPQVNPWTGKITVIAVHRTAQAGNIKAFATIMIGNALEIRDIKIIQQARQRAYVRLPDRPRTDGQGYAAIVSCHDERLQEAISQAVLAAWQEGSWL